MEAVNELNKLVSEQILPIESAKLDINVAQAELQEVESKALLLKQALAKTEEPTLNLNKEEETIASKSEINARDYLKKLLEKCNDLQKQIDLIGELHKQDKALKDKVNVIGDDLNAMLLRYQEAPQSLLEAEDDLRKADSIKARLDETNQQLHALKTWTAQQMAGNDEAKELIKAVEDTLTHFDSQLSKLTLPLKEEVEAGKSQESKKNSIIEGIKNLSDQAKHIHSLEDASEKSAQLKKLQKEIEPLEKQLLQLQQDTKPGSRVMPLENAELIALQKSVQDLANALTNEEMDAAKKLANDSAAATIQQLTTSLRNSIHKAEKIDSDPNASEDDLLKATNILEESKPQLEGIQEIINTLDPADDDANLVRNNASNNQSQLGETLAILLQSLNDRLQALTAFNEEKRRVELELAQLAQDLESAQKASEPNVEKMHGLLQKNADLLPQLFSLNNLVDALKPMTQPSAQLDSLLQRQKDLEAQIQKASDIATENKKQRLIVQVYSDNLEAIEDQLQQAEQNFILLKPGVNELNSFAIEMFNPVLQQSQALDLTDAPNEDLKRRKQQVKQQAKKLQAKLEEKQKHAIAQEELVSRLDQQIADSEAVLANILSRYEQPQEVAEALKDAKALEKVREGVIALPLDEISEKATREQLSQRIEPLRVEANVSIKAFILF